MIENTKDLADYIGSLNGDFRAMDLEADSLHRYSEKMSLIQFTDGENHQLIDPLAIDDMQPLKDFLSSAKLWMHGADYDIVLMRRDLDTVPPMIYDTQIGARLLGVQKFGYANLVEHYCGEEISKSSQKADWAKRPLTNTMRKYAINDVLYLKPIVDQILEGLYDKGRYDWFIESCENARDKVLDRPMSKEDPWRISGSGKLQPKALAYLRALWYWRDEEARIWDRPTFMVCGNKQLIAWAMDLANDKTPLFPKHFRSTRRKNFSVAVDEVKGLAENLYPQRPKAKGKRIKDASFDKRVEDMLVKRDRVAAELEIDSSLLINRALLETIAAQEVKPSDVLMKWQAELLDF